MMGKRGHLIAPSLLASNFAQLEREVSMINASSADWLHLDVMDGHFVPNISFGVPVVRDVAAVCHKVVDVHLMISRPERYVEVFRKAGAEVITVHLEACDHLHRVVHQIKDLGAKAGVAVNPHTSADLLEDVLEDVDMVCLMSVNPGFGGQKFIYRTIPKIRKLKQQLDERNLHALIQVDGGVGLQNAEAILQAGADVLVAGSSVFNADNPTETIQRLKAIGKEALHNS